MTRHDASVEPPTAVVPALTGFTVDDREFVVLAIHGGRDLTTADVTAAESEVARALAAGRSANWIARRRGTSRRTVEHQINSLYRKLGVASRQELIRALLCKG